MYAQHIRLITLRLFGYISQGSFLLTVLVDLGGRIPPVVIENSSMSLDDLHDLHNKVSQGYPGKITLKTLSVDLQILYDENQNTGQLLQWVEKVLSPELAEAIKARRQFSGAKLYITDSIMIDGLKLTI